MLCLKRPFLRIRNLRSQRRALSLPRLYGRRSWFWTIQTPALKRYDCICFAAHPAIYTQAAQPRPFRPVIYTQTMQSRPFRRAFAMTGNNSLSPCVPSESFRADFFIFRAENGESRTGGQWCGGARGVPLHCGFMRAEKVFVPQDVKCRRKLCKLSRISKKPSFEGF